VAAAAYDSAVLARNDHRATAAVTDVTLSSNWMLPVLTELKYQSLLSLRYAAVAADVVHRLRSAVRNAAGVVRKLRLTAARNVDVFQCFRWLPQNLILLLRVLLTLPMMPCHSLTQQVSDEVGVTDVAHRS
jgi:hypothetical protein